VGGGVTLLKRALKRRGASGGGSSAFFGRVTLLGVASITKRRRGRVGKIGGCVSAKSGG